MDNTSLVSVLVGLSYPPAVETAPARSRRIWIARTEGPLPDSVVLEELARRAERDALEALMQAYVAVVGEEAVRDASPRVSISLADSRHVLIAIESGSGDAVVGASAATAQWAPLQSIDAALAFADLQGIPRQFWFPLGHRDGV